VVNFNSINYKEHNFKSDIVKLNFDSSYIQFKKNNSITSNYKPNQIQVSTIDKSFSDMSFKMNSNNNYKKIENTSTYIESPSDIVIPLNENKLIFKNNELFLNFCKDYCINPGDILFESKADGSFGRTAEVIVVNYRQNLICVKVQTENGPVNKTYKLDEFLSETHLNGYINMNKPSDEEKKAINAKYRKKFIDNVAVPIAGGIVSFIVYGSRMSYHVKGPHGEPTERFVNILGQYFLKSAYDAEYGIVDENLDYSNMTIGDFFHDEGINESIKSTIVWSIPLYLQDTEKYKLIDRVPDWKEFKSVGTEQYFVTNTRLANAGLTFAITAGLDLSNTVIEAEKDAMKNGEARYYKQYAKSKFINDLDENLCDIIGATILDFFCPGLGSWLGGPILSGFYESSYELTEYILEINGKPVPSRPMNDYDNFIRKRTAISILHTSARELYDAKCQVYPAGSIERKSAKVQYNVDDIGYGTWQAVCYLAKNSINDSEINDIKYSKTGQYNKFGFPENGLSSYGFVEWVIHNSGYKISLDSLREKGSGTYIGSNVDFGVSWKHGKINVGDILYSTTEDEQYLISGESRTAIVTRVKQSTIDSPGEIEIIEQTENGPVKKVYILDSFDEITSEFDKFIGMRSYYEDIDKNVDYSRGDIQETINMIKEMENNGD